MLLQPAAFNAMLAGMGQAVSWRRGNLCPCRNPETGEAPRTCPQCHGNGKFWSPAVDAWAGVAGQRTQRQWRDFGQYQTGDEVLTIPSDSPLYLAGEGDRIVMLQSSVPFDEALTRGADDRLQGVVHAIDRVFWLDPTTRAVVEGAIPAVGADGVLTWATGAPPAGVQYSVRGRRRPIYEVYGDLPQDRAHCGGAALPRRIVARKADLAQR